MRLKLIFAACSLAFIGLGCQPSATEFHATNDATNKEKADADWQSAGIAANGYRKPGAAVAMRFTLPDGLQPGDSGVLTTSWVLEDDAENLNINIAADDALNVVVSAETNLPQPVTGQAYELSIPFTAANGQHTINFVATTQGSREEKRSFAIIIEAGEAVVVRQKASTISSTVNGERLHIMQTTPK